MLACLRVQAETPRAALDGRRRKKCRFEEHIAGRRGDSRARAAHDAGEPYGSIAVGNDEHVIAESHGTRIEELQPLRGVRVARADLPVQRRQVVGMHRLAELE